MKIRQALLLVCTFSAVLLTSSSASAAESTLEISVGPDPVESVATLFEATGTAIHPHEDVFGHVDWSVHPAGGTGCGPDPQHDSGHIATAGSELFSALEEELPYHVSANWTPVAAGSYLLCGWLNIIESGKAVSASASLPFTVRAPHLSVALRAPTTVRVGRRFHVTTTAQAEAPRKLYEYIVPNNRGGVCPANAAAASSRAHVIDPNLGPGSNVNIWAVNGGPFSKTFTESLTHAGAWLVCAYYQYGSTSNPPEASTSAAITASARTRPPLCRKGFKKQRVHGKAKCVKVKKGRHKSARQLAAPSAAPIAVQNHHFDTVLERTTLEQQCIKAGLIMPKVKHAYMLNPGDKPFSGKDPSVAGPTQMVKLAATYRAVPQECTTDYTFVREASVQMKTPSNKWAFITTPWAWVDKSGAKIYDRGVGEPNGHEGNWYYWKPGKKVKAVFENLVEDSQTGKTLASKTKIAHVQIGLGKSH